MGNAVTLTKVIGPYYQCRGYQSRNSAIPETAGRSPYPFRRSERIPYFSGYALSSHHIILRRRWHMKTEKAVGEFLNNRTLAGLSPRTIEFYRERLLERHALPSGSTALCKRHPRIQPTAHKFYLVPVICSFWSWSTHTYGIQLTPTLR